MVFYRLFFKSLMTLPSTLRVSLTQRTLGPTRLYSRLYHSVRRAPEPVPPEIVDLLSSFASHQPLPISLTELLSFGHPLTPQSILDSVRYALHEIPRRLATRVRHLEGLPFIVGMNPYVSSTLQAYRDSFLWLATYPEVKNLEENEAFTAELENLVGKHANDVATMAKGYISLLVWTRSQF